MKKDKSKFSKMVVASHRRSETPESTFVNTENKVRKMEAEGCFAIINWWIDDNMLENFVYHKKNGESNFTLFSDEGISTCVWEMAVWWHERNAWVKHALLQHNNPDFEAYLNDQLNTDI